MTRTLRILPVCFAILSWASAVDAAASAAEPQRNPEMTETQSADNSDVVLYNFGDDLMNAIQNCTPYREDFVANNPGLKQVFVDYVSNAELSVPIEIYGVENDFCHFSVQYGLLGQNTVYDCRLNGEQLGELIAAMNDRSVEPVTETFMSEPQEIIDEKGNKKVISSKMTVTGGRFMVTAVKMRQYACKLRIQTLSDEEQAELDAKARMLPKEFTDSLSKCEAAHTRYKMFVMEENVDILGWEKDKCHLTYRDFDLYLPKSKLKSVQTFDDFSGLLAEPTIAKYNYRATYNYEGLLFELAACYQKQELESNHKTYITYSDGVDAVSGVAGLGYTDESCRLELVNVLRVRDKVTDYGVICEIPSDDLERLVAPHLRLAEVFGEKSFENTDGKIEWQSSVSNEQTRYVDGILMYDLQRHGYCERKNPQEATSTLATNEAEEKADETENASLEAEPEENTVAETETSVSVENSTQAETLNAAEEAEQVQENDVASVVATEGKTEPDVSTAAASTAENEE
ncbi:MAG: hypothetical protein IJ738_01245 [Alphaproteobacteria bacterium]|nr:hypothetical protein [Alphaproteobacteria bacterium]